MSPAAVMPAHTHYSMVNAVLGSSPDQNTLYEAGGYMRTNIKIIPVPANIRKPLQARIPSQESFATTLTPPVAHNHSTLVAPLVHHHRAFEAEDDEVHSIVNGLRDLPSLRPSLDVLHQSPIVYQSDLEDDEQQEAVALNFDELDEENVLNFYDLSAKDSKDNVIPFSLFKGQIVLIVNIATQCMASYQLKQLEKLYQAYKDHGFIILGFPSNQFFQERTDSIEDITTKCTKRHNVSFPIMEKIMVNGKNQHDVFKYLKDHKKGFLGSTRVKWNFEKFLIDREGHVIRRYSTLQKAPKQISSDLDMIFQQEDELALHYI